MNRPWFKFYRRDWRSDSGLRACSAEARGVWIEMILVMEEADPMGFLLIGGAKPSAYALAQVLAYPEAVVERALSELATHRVYSISEAGVVFCRKMVRDAERSEKLSEWGKKGGNPSLKDKADPKPKDKARHKPSRVSRALLLTSASSSLADSSFLQDTSQGGEVAAPAQPSPPASKPPANGHAPRKISDTPGARFLAWWQQAFRAATKSDSHPDGLEYAFEGGKDGEKLKGIVAYAKGDESLMRERAQAMLDSTDPFYANNGVNLSTLHSAWNRLASSGRPSQSRFQGVDDDARQVAENLALVKRVTARMAVSQ